MNERMLMKHRQEGQSMNDELQMVVNTILDEMGQMENRFNTAVNMVVDEMGQMEDRINKRMDEKFQKVDEKFQRIDKQFQKVDERFQRIDEKFQRVDERLERLETRMESTEGRLMKIEVDLLENNVIPRLNTIEECYLSTCNRYLASSERMDGAFTDIDLLKRVVSDHSEKLQRIS